jgi:hypothetical protein
MSRNLISLTFSNDQLTAIGGAMGVLEDHLSPLIALSLPDRKSALKMGAKSEVFCRQTLLAMRQNPQILPPTIDLGDAEADLLALDQLRPFLRRLQRLFERARDTELALGSDVMATALKGYSQLKLAGNTEGLKALSKELGGRFSKGPRQQPEPEPSAA